MRPATTAWAAAASSAGTLPASVDLVIVALVGSALLLAVAALFAMLLFSRRRLDQDVRRVVLALEELRSGRGRPRLELDAPSPLIVVADSVQRLAQDLHARSGEANHVQEQLRAVLETFRDSAVIATDVDGDVRRFDGAATAMLGWTEDDIVARPVSQLFAEGEYERFLPKLARRTLREAGLHDRALLRRKDGTTFPADLTVRMMHGASGDPVGFLVVARDLTRRTRMEAELRASEARYRGLVEGMTDGVLIVRDGRIAYANPAFAALCEQTADALVGTPLRDRLATRDVLLVEERLSLAQRRTEPQQVMRCALLGADRLTLAEVRLHASGIDHADGPAVLVLVHDETAARRVEAELRRNESQLDAVLEATSDGMLVLVDGTEGPHAQMTNRAFVEMTGLQQRELLGQTLVAVRAALRRRGGGCAAIADFLDSGATPSDGAIVQLPGPREVSLDLTPLRDQEGRTIGRVLACRDLTAQRESQRKLQQHADQVQLGKVMLEQAYRKLDTANHELKTKTTELNAVNRELRTLDEMKSNLLGNVSHELQTPLVSIRGYTEMILKRRLGPVTEEQRKGLTLSLKNIDRLISMIDNILAFARSEPERPPLVLMRFEFAPLVHEAIELLADRAAEQRVTIDASFEDEQVEIYADRDGILQVLINLLSNAVKFNRPGGRVDVRATGGARGFVAVEVSDTGIGIPPEHVEHIFERNYQVRDAAGQQTAGSGIGLAIVRDILRLHGCRIRVVSRPEAGSRFTFTLPLASDGAEEREDAAPAPPTAAPEATEPSDGEARGARAENSDREPVPPPERSWGTGVEPSRPDPDNDPKPRFRIIRRP